MLPREIQVVLSCQGPAHDPSWPDATLPNSAINSRRCIPAPQVQSRPSYRIRQDMCVAKSDVCFTPNSDRESDFRKRSCLLYPPESGYVQCNGPCLLWANSGHRGPYSNTSSARPISVLGMVRPSALAVFILSTVSYSDRTLRAARRRFP